MITLGELLANNILKDFRFATKKIGLNNPIMSTGFFEWESKADIMKTFQQGEFVVTTLSIAKDDKNLAFDSIKTLILNQAAAIAIKDVYFDNIPDYLIELAEKNNVPILFFSDMYIDDILFNVRMSLLHEYSSHEKEPLISELITEEDLTVTQKKKLINEINPYFIDGAVICSYIKKKEGSISRESFQKIFRDHEFSKEFHSYELDPAKTFYIFIPFNNGMFLIYSTCEEKPITSQTITAFLKCYYKDKDQYFIGISNVHDRLINLDIALKEAIYAQTIGTIDNEKNVEFDVSDSKHILCSLCYNPWIEKYYTTVYSKLDPNKADGDKILLDTLASYIESEGDINNTSEIMFQHSNTIRYRLSKAKKLLNINNDSIFFGKVYNFIYLYKIRILLDPIFRQNQ